MVTNRRAPAAKKKPAVNKNATKKSGTAARGVPARAAAQRVPADDPWSTFRVEALTSIFSGSGLARLVGVSPSQPSRWASGEERPGPTTAPTLIDLEYIVARARLNWGPDAARIWVESPNVFLGGARPVDVLRKEGSAPVLQALDAEMWGGAA